MSDINRSQSEPETMSVDEALNQWRQMVYGYEQVDPTPRQNGYKSGLLLEIYKPRFKHFHPPFWWIFRWAYKIESRRFEGVYPAGCSTSQDSVEIPPEGIPLKFE